LAWVKPGSAVATSPSTESQTGTPPAEAMVTSLASHSL
jgi:hypothetical protein